jgi:hypothetical protein
VQELPAGGVRIAQAQGDHAESQITLIGEEWQVGQPQERGPALGVATLAQ